MSPYTNWLSKVSESDVLMAPLGSGGVVTVDMGGYVRLWETGLDTLQRSLMEWRNMIGSEDGRPIQVISQLNSLGNEGVLASSLGCLNVVSRRRLENEYNDPCSLQFLLSPLNGSATSKITHVNRISAKCHSAYLPHSGRKY